MDPTIAAIATAGLGVVTGICGTYFWARAKYNALTKAERDVRYQETIEALNRKSEEFKKAEERNAEERKRDSIRYDDLYTVMDRRVKAQEAKTDECEAQHLECLKKGYQLEAAQSMMQSELAALKVATKHSFFCASILADKTGKITDATDDVYPIFGWRAGELIGQHIGKIIAPGFRTQHHDGFAKAIELGAVRSKNAAVIGDGLHKNGSLIPVVVALEIRQVTANGGEVPIVKATIYQVVDMFSK